MFLLDTNIISELLRPSPDPAVETWVGDRRATDLYFSAIGEAARDYADIAAMRRAVGRTVPPADSQIAAIARSRGMAVATRNIRNFENIGIEVIDPWTAA